MSDTAESPPVTPPPIEPKPQRLALWRKALVGVIFVVLIAALVIGLLRLAGGGNGATTVSGSSVPTSVPSTAVAREEPPTLFNTGTGDNVDWDRMVRSMMAYQKWLYDHRRPDLLPNVAKEENPDYQTTLLGLTNLASHPDWHYDPAVPAVEVRSVRFVTRPAPDKALLSIQFGPSPRSRVVDGNGTVVYDDPGLPARTVQWTLQQDSANRWRLLRIDPQ